MNQSQNSDLSYSPDGGVSFKQRILGWLQGVSESPFDREVYKQRNLVEQLINRLKQFRRLAARYEKRGANYRAMRVIASNSPMA